MGETEKDRYIHVRIKYSKQGALKFIGHLDMMRSFQKLLRRARVDVAFSEGFSPHMIMSYAFPLGVGMTSDSEYVDVQLDPAGSGSSLVRRLNEEAPEGIHFLDARQIQPGKANKGMALVARADYTLAFREGRQWPEEWKRDFEMWLGKREILVTKKGKKTEKQINIRPLIYEASVSEEGEEGQRIRLALSAGSAASIRPEMVMQTFASGCGFDFTPFMFQINRDEVYADCGSGEEHEFVPLIDLGTEIG